MIKICFFARPLRQTVSWETPMCAAAIAPRTMSIDASDATNRCSNISDESSNIVTLVNSSSENENHEAGAWSSDYSNSEDEYTNLEDSIAPVSFFKLNKIFNLFLKFECNRKYIFLI